MESKFVALQNGACLSALVVDDSELYRAYAQRILKSAGYTVHTASSGEDAILLLKNIPAPNVILLDVIMKGLDGYETFAVISESEGTSEIPVIFLTAETQSHNELKGFKMGAADYISKPFIPEIMLKRVEKVIELDLLKKDLAKQVSLKTAQLEIISNQAIETIAAIIDARERYANGHSTRVAKVSTEIARTLGWSREKQMEIYDIALLHDVGKIAIPDLVLNKPTKLTDSEYDIIKAHTTAGSEMLKEISVIKGMSEGARWHHERYDGKGYPDGLRGTEIPPSARIIGIADAYDAMASKRPYRNGFPNDFIIDELIKGRGTQFDPMLSDIMVKIIRSGEKINEIEGLGVVKGSLASECSALLYHVYNKSIQENRREMGLDGLTQVYSRKFFEMDITGVLAEQSGSLLMIDIDNYKKINDTYGHITGDNILMLLADTLRLNIGEGDYVGRMGGDEFAVFMPKATDKAGIKKVIKIIFQKFNEDKKYIDTMGLCSLSVGVAIAKKPKAHFDTLYRQADIALYHVKDSGKKSYCYYEDLLEARENYVRSKTKEDVNNLKRYLKGRFSGDDSFEKRYEYELVYYTLANNMIDGANVRFIVFTLVDMRNLNGKEAIRKSMRDLNFAVEKSMREYDFSIKYSENQYILMLQNVSEAALTSVGVRISLAYREACEEKDIEIIYSVS